MPVARKDEELSESRMTTTRILIVDDHPIVRQGYEQLIGTQADLEVCGWAATADEAFKQAKATGPALAIVDITLKDSNSVELIKQLQTRHPNLKVLVVSAHDETLYAERALEAGALGYINKQEALDRLIEAIRDVLAGDVYVSERITRRLLKRRVSGAKQQEEKPQIESLTDRELEVFEMVGHGQSTKQIAARLHLSPKTIERYKENIKGKLGIGNSTELVQQATRWVLENG